MTETQSKEMKLSDEFRQLGENLVATLRIAWNHPNKGELQQEVASGLAELAGTLNDEARNFTESAAAQRMEVEREYLSPGGEERSPLQDELASALQKANASLKEVVEHWATGPTLASGEEMPTPASWQPGHERMEVHPDDVSAPPRDTGHREFHPDDVESGNTTVDLGE